MSMFSNLHRRRITDIIMCFLWWWGLRQTTGGLFSLPFLLQTTQWRQTALTIDSWRQNGSKFTGRLTTACERITHFSSINTHRLFSVNINTHTHFCKTGESPSRRRSWMEVFHPDSSSGDWSQIFRALFAHICCGWWAHCVSSADRISHSGLRYITSRLSHSSTVCLKLTHLGFMSEGVSVMYRDETDRSAPTFPLTTTPVNKFPTFFFFFFSHWQTPAQNRLLSDAWAGLDLKPFRLWVSRGDTVFCDGGL